VSDEVCGSDGVTYTGVRRGVRVWRCDIYRCQTRCVGLTV